MPQQFRQPGTARFLAGSAAVFAQEGDGSHQYTVASDLAGKQRTFEWSLVVVALLISSFNSAVVSVQAIWVASRSHQPPFE